MAYANALSPCTTFISASTLQTRRLLQVKTEIMHTFTPVQDGENITFSWQFVGTGSQRCYHDEVFLPGPCSSPMSVTAKSVSGASSITHVFRVEFTDVCGNSKNASYMYTQEGVTALTKIDYIPVTALADRAPPAPGVARRTGSTTSAAAAHGHQHSSWMSRLFAGFLGVLLTAAATL